MLQMAAIAKEGAPPPPDAAVVALAHSQYGVVARHRLRGLGLSDGAIAHRVAAGRLLRLHHGVYAVGHTRLLQRGRWMAAVLSCARGAVLSHAAAGALWELRTSDATIVTVTVTVTVPGSGGRRRRRGIRLHHRGAAKVLAVLQDHGPGTTMTKSELEERFLALCRAAGLPQPRVNRHVEGFDADFVFVAHRVLDETDSWRHHRSRDAFERDRRRDAVHAAAGWRTLRFTWRQVEREPQTVAAAVEAALYRGASAASSLA